MSSRITDFTVGMVRLLSMRASELDKFLQETALCEREEREVIGAIRSYEHLTGDTSLSVFIPIMQYLGRAKKGRTELTDLGYFVSMSDRKQARVSKDEIADFRKQLAILDKIKGRVPT